MWSTLQPFYVFVELKPLAKRKQMGKKFPKNLLIILYTTFFGLNFLPFGLLALSLPLLLSLAVVNCNLKNITANCQNALTFTNYFAGSELV